MRRLEELPDLPAPTPFLLVALVLTIWLTLRIRIQQRRQARQVDAGLEVQTSGWLGAVAAKAWVLPALALIALLLVAATVASFLV